MSTRTHRRGLTTSGAILSVVGAVVVIGGAAYMFSDVWSTKMESAYSQFSDWTPENIAKDPVNYLNFCEKRAKDAQTKLKARKISIAQKKGTLATKQEVAQEEVNKRKAALLKLKELKDSAESSNSWPVKHNNKELSKEELGKLAVEFRRQMDQQSKLLEHASVGVKKLEKEETRVSDAMSKLDIQLDDITTKREMLAIKEITNEITDDLVSMRNVLAGVVEIGDEGDTVSVDDFVDDDSGVSDADVDAAFEGL